MPIGNIENSATFGISGIWSVPNRGNRSRLAPDFGIDGIHPVLFDPPHTGSYNRTVLAALSLPAGVLHRMVEVQGGPLHDECVLRADAGPLVRKVAILRLRPDDFLNDPRRSIEHRMNRNIVLASALAAAFPTVFLHAQTAAAPAAAATAPAAVAPQAVPAKIAIIEYEQVAAATNEGQRALQELQTKYQPKKAQLDALGAEIESLQKQLQAAPATMTDDERASRARTIDTKQKQYQRDAEDATNAYNSDVQEAIGKVAQKLGPVVIKYVQQNGYTMLLDNNGQQQGGLTLMWAPGTDISQAVVDAYNASSGVAAPPPAAPAPQRPRSAAPAAKPGPSK